MNALLNQAASRAIVYTKLGQTLRISLRPGLAPERQLARWLNRQVAANPGFPVRVKSVLLVVGQLPCPACRRALTQALRRWNLAGRLRLVVNAPPGVAAAPACSCPGTPAAGYGDLFEINESPRVLAELEGGPYGSAATQTFPLAAAGKKLRALGWRRGIYVIKKNNTPVYVGKASTLYERIQQHALCLTHLLISLAEYTVQIYHYPTANDTTLLAKERERYLELKKSYTLGNKLNTELAQELDELALEYEGLFERFRTIFRRNPVKAAVIKGALDAANPLPVQTAALADQQQALIEERVAAAPLPPPRWMGPPRSNWQHPASVYNSRLPSVRVKTPVR